MCPRRKGNAWRRLRSTLRGWWRRTSRLRVGGGALGTGSCCSERHQIRLEYSVTALHWSVHRIFTTSFLRRFLLHTPTEPHNYIYWLPVLDAQGNELIKVRELDQPYPTLGLAWSKRNRLVTASRESVGDTPHRLLLVRQAEVDRHTTDDLWVWHV